MTQLHVIEASAETTAQAIAELDAQWSRIAGRCPDHQVRLALVFYGCRHDDIQLHHYLRDRFANAAVLGGSSSGGLMTHHGVLGPDGVGLMLIDDRGGDYGVAAAALDDDPAGLAERLLHQALNHSGCADELPELIWIYQSPGVEERVLEGLRRVVGNRCAIVGGSSGDDDVCGQWRQMGPQGPMSHGLVVGVLMPSAPIGTAFQSGYEPTGEHGIVTEVRSAHGSANTTPGPVRGRDIISIDGEPAAQVYNRWTHGLIESHLSDGGTILCPAAQAPIAVSAGSADGIEQYLLIHPASVDADGTLHTFCEVPSGASVYAMRGSRDRLIARAGRVVRSAQRALDGHPLAGALIVYCGGCKLAVGEDMPAVADAIRDVAGPAPFIGCFTFGEQGRLLQHNVHGNLMVSAVAFGA